MAQEVERLRRENAVLKRELAGRSPSKRVLLAERDDFAAGQTLSTSSSPASSAGISSAGTPSGDGAMANLSSKLERMRVASTGGDSVGSVGASGSTKKVRKLPTKRWEELRAED